jgi:hypothetical protein
VVGVVLPLTLVFRWRLFEGPEVVLLVLRPVSCDAGPFSCVLLQSWIYWVCVALWYRWLLLSIVFMLSLTLGKFGCGRVPPCSGCLLLDFFFAASYGCAGLVVLDLLLSPNTWICD